METSKIKTLQEITAWVAVSSLLAVFVFGSLISFDIDNDSHWNYVLSYEQSLKKGMNISSYTAYLFFTHNDTDLLDELKMSEYLHCFVKILLIAVWLIVCNQALAEEGGNATRILFCIILISMTIWLVGETWYNLYMNVF